MSIASQHTTLVDLTMPLSSKTIPVPGHPAPMLTPLHLLERDGVRNTLMCMSLHTGTHVDAPSHFIEDGSAIDEIPLERFHRPGLRLDLTGIAPGAAISLENLRRAGFDPGSTRDTILLLASGWSDAAWQEPRLYGGNPYLATDAAEAIAEAGPSAIGLDFAVDHAKPWPNHSILLSADVLLIENLMGLPALPERDFDVLSFPLRIEGENGAPARVVASVPSGTAAA
ncbi:MAG: cyclase family protein [Conexibacter sp.]